MVKVSRLYYVQACLCFYYSVDYSADSSETESFFFLDLPEIIL